MFTRQVPVCAILLDGQSMAGSEMPSKHLPAPAAFEANDMIAVGADRRIATAGIRSLSSSGTGLPTVARA